MKSLYTAIFILLSLQTFGAAPTAPSSNLYFAAIDGGYFNLGWTPGNGARRIIICKAGGPVTFTPQNGVDYAENTIFGSGQQVAKWEATPVNGNVKLQWTTSAELNASHFIVERSADGINFSSIITVQATGNSQSDINYSKDDNDPLPGKSYYRLKTVDIDGQFEYSSIRSVLLSAKQSAILMRNPVQNVLELVTAAVAGNKNEWQILGITGQLIKKRPICSTRTEVNVSALPPGRYWLRLTINSQPETISFIKQ